MAPLVESNARRYRRVSGDLSEDLVQEGYLGLLAALEHWDPARGVKFSTYATHFIVGSIRHFLRDRSRPIREPLRLTALARRIDTAVSALSQQLGRAPRPDEIAAALEVSEESVGEALAVRDLSAPVSTNSLDGEWETADDTVPLAQLVEDRTVLGQALSVLRPREQEVVYEHFFRDLSQSEIARKLGISANYVSVTLRRSTERLRRVLCESEVLDSGGIREARLVDPETGLYTRLQTNARLLEGVSRAARENGLFGVVSVRLSGLPVAGRSRGAILGE
ncbi:MAG: sigma-70 family RNA polymerase sigma factor, partial [Armatimonadaceae bacterium]